MRYVLACLLLAACGDVYEVDGLDRPTRVEGRLVIESDYDVDLYREVEEVDGDLVMATGPLDSVDLPRLVRVTGRVQIDGDRVALSALEEVGGQLGLTRSVQFFEAPRLGTVGELNITSGAVYWLDLSSLVEVTGDVVVVGNSDLAQCYVDWLIGRADIGGHIQNTDNAEGCTCSGDPPLPVCPTE